MSEDIIKPNNLSECFEHLDKIISESEDADWFKSTDEEDAVIQSHHGLGRWIRNNWGLWSKDSKLFEYLSKLGLHHPDDMSSIILKSYHRHLNKKELGLDEQVKHYIDFWKEQE
ncbi:MAG: DUF6794 domain-containing protein [Nanoarchaeota archaeon]